MNISVNNNGGMEGVQYMTYVATIELILVYSCKSLCQVTMTHPL